jgi:alpha-1,6-mannosyltransferase
MRPLIALGATLTGLSCLALLPALWDRGGPMGSYRPLATFVLAASVPVYFMAVCLVQRLSLPRGAVWVVLIVSILSRLPLLFAPPLLSSDIYRYVWDGRVQAAGINPYLFVPADPALSELRDDAIYSHINRADYAHTIYPPAAQIVFAAVGHLSQTVFAEKLMMAAFEALAIACGLSLLSLARLPPAQVLVYAWNPLAVWSFACDGHVDAVAVGLLAVALLLRCRGRDGWAGAVFGAAVLVKFLPAAVGPALWRRGGGWRFVACGTAVLAALYLCYAGAGWGVLGFLHGYTGEEGLDNGSGVWLLAWLGAMFPLPAYATAVYGATALVALSALSLWIMTRRQQDGVERDVLAVCGSVAVLASCVTVAISPHYPWYFAWLALPAIVKPGRAVIWLSAAPIVLFLKPFDNQYLWPSRICAVRPTHSPLP